MCCRSAGCVSVPVFLCKETNSVYLRNYRHKDPEVREK
jgi:hypothetical protein